MWKLEQVPRDAFVSEVLSLPSCFRIPKGVLLFQSALNKVGSPRFHSLYPDLDLRTPPTPLTAPSAAPFFPLICFCCMSGKIPGAGVLGDPEPESGCPP